MIFCRRTALYAVAIFWCATSCQGPVDTTTIVPLVPRNAPDASSASAIPGDPDELTPAGNAATLFTWFRTHGLAMAQPTPDPTQQPPSQTSPPPQANPAPQPSVAPSASPFQSHPSGAAAGTPTPAMAPVAAPAQNAPPAMPAAFAPAPMAPAAMPAPAQMAAPAMPAPAVPAPTPMPSTPPASPSTAGASAPSGTWAGGGTSEGTIGLGNAAPGAGRAISSPHAGRTAGATLGRSWDGEPAAQFAAPPTPVQPVAPAPPIEAPQYAAAAPPARVSARSARYAIRNNGEPPHLSRQMARDAPGHEAPMPMMTAPAIAAPTATAPTPTTPATVVTNNQVEGVDEGDIVKVWGDYLVVLRRGRLFTIHLGTGRPTSAARVDAWPPAFGMPASWYDEILVHGDTILVIGFGGGAGGTQVNRFRIDASGALTYRDTLTIRSNDYFARENYASRVVGNRLVIYTPVPVVAVDAHAIETAIPVVRTGLYQSWQTVLDYSRLFLPVQDTTSIAVIHSTLVCDLAQPAMTCRATGVVGPSSRQFFVSNTAVYVWVPGAPWQRVRGAPATPGAERAVVYRFPLDGDPPSAIRVSGRPENQLSFEERDGELHVLVRGYVHPDGTYNAAELGLLRIPTARFRRHLEYPGAEALTVLPAARDVEAKFVNRFVANHLLWNDIDRTPAGAVDVIVRVHDLASRTTASVPITHGVERLEAMGDDAVVVGNGEGSLRFTAIDLGATPAARGTFTLPDARQGESRSHGFFYSPGAADHGTIGLPFVDADFVRTRTTMNQGSAGIVFLRVDDLQFGELGRLEAHPSAHALMDQCVASCTDWYGNARPLFVEGRTFALLGYELVEGRIANGQMRETSRLEFLGALPSLEARRRE